MLMSILFSVLKSKPRKLLYWQLSYQKCVSRAAAKQASCATQWTLLLCHTADMPAVSHGRHVCCVTRQTSMLRHAADRCAAPRSRRVCCVTQQTCLLCNAADMSAA